MQTIELHTSTMLADELNAQAWELTRVDYKKPGIGHYVIELTHKRVYRLRFRPSDFAEWDELSEHETQLAAMLAASIDINERKLELETNTPDDIDW